MKKLKKTNPEEKMGDFLNHMIAQLQLFPVWGIVLFCFISACLQQVFPPYPSEVLLLVLGGLAVTDVIAGPAAIIPYVVGTVASSLIVFRVSRRVGGPVLKNRYVRRIFPRRNQRVAGVYMRRYGAPALAICKFLPGVNTVCLIVGGVMGLRGVLPMTAIVVAGIVQNTIYFFAGMAIGNNLPRILSFSKEFSVGAAIFAGAAAGAFLLFKFRKKIFKKAGI